MSRMSKTQCTWNAYKFILLFFCLIDDTWHLESGESIKEVRNQQTIIARFIVYY